MDENHGVRVKRSRVADLGQVVREIAFPYITLAMYKRLYYLRRKECMYR